MSQLVQLVYQPHYIAPFLAFSPPSSSKKNDRGGLSQRRRTSISQILPLRLLPGLYQPALPYLASMT